MQRYTLILSNPRPYFAEFPYALWGEVNYDSDGDCQRPTDQQWTALHLRQRITGESLQITSSGDEFVVESDEPELAARAAMFLVERSEGVIVGEDPRPHIGTWSYATAYANTSRIRSEFMRQELDPFDSHLFWGSWKWVGWFATEYTWVGRWIMNSLLVVDPRAVCLCIDWLKSGTMHPEQSVALRHALNILTSQTFPSDEEWIAWYERGTGHDLYPQPDFDAWLEELKQT